MTESESAYDPELARRQNEQVHEALRADWKRREELRNNEIRSTHPEGDSFEMAIEELIAMHGRLESWRRRLNPDGQEAVMQAQSDIRHATGLLQKYLGQQA